MSDDERGSFSGDNKTLFHSGSCLSQAGNQVFFLENANYGRGVGMEAPHTPVKLSGAQLSLSTIPFRQTPPVLFEGCGGHLKKQALSCMRAERDFLPASLQPQAWLRAARVSST